MTPVARLQKFCTRTAKVLPDGATHKALASAGPGQQVSVLTTLQQGATPLQPAESKEM